MNWGIISAIIAIMLFIISVMLSLRLVRKKEPVWAYKTTHIIGLGTSAPRELKLTYSGKPVRDVYRSTFIIFNKGSEPIRENDVTSPINLSLKGGEILSEPAIRRTSNTEIKFSAKRVRNNDIKLGFKYLDHDDGAVFEIIHTTIEQISCDANIIGTKKMVYKGEFEDIMPPPLNIGSIAIIILGIAGIVFVGLTALEKLALTGRVLDIGVPISILFGVLLVSLLSNVIPRYIRSKKFPTWSKAVTKTIIPTYTKGAEVISAYCFKCRTRKTTMLNSKIVTLKNGRPALTATCPDCGGKLFKILAA